MENGIIRCQKFCDTITKAVNDCIKTAQRITKNKIIKLSGLSKNTVRKYWDEVVNDLAPQASVSVKNETIVKHQQQKTERRTELVIHYIDKKNGIQPLAYYAYHYGDEDGKEMYENQFLIRPQKHLSRNI